MEYELERPSHGLVHVAHDLALKVINVNSGTSMAFASVASGKNHAGTTIVLTSEQVRILARFSPEFTDRHIEAPHSGSLIAVGTLIVGTFTGVGKVYLQTAIDSHSRIAFGRLYTNKLPVTAIHTY